MVFVAKLMEDSAFVRLEKIKKVRTLKQNASLHKLFQHISDELTELGHTFKFEGINIKSIDIPYTPAIVKECIWKPLENALLEKSSTTELTSNDIEMIFDVLCKWFGEKGVHIVWPSESEEYHNYLKSKK
jgi:hypothetical protein